jgi:hypothetical protein
MSDNFQTRIETTQPRERVVFVDKYDDDELWLSIQINGGGANCTLTFEQAKQMIAALQTVIDGVPVPEEEEPEIEEDEDTCPACHRGEMCLTGAKLHYVCDLCGHSERVEEVEP